MIRFAAVGSATAAAPGTGILKPFRQIVQLTANQPVPEDLATALAAEWDKDPKAARQVYNAVSMGARKRLEGKSKDGTAEVRHEIIGLELQTTDTLRQTGIKDKLTQELQKRTGPWRQLLSTLQIKARPEVLAAIDDKAQEAGLDLNG